MEPIGTLVLETMGEFITIVVYKISSIISCPKDDPGIMMVSSIVSMVSDWKMLVASPLRPIHTSLPVLLNIKMLVKHGSMQRLL